MSLQHSAVDGATRTDPPPVVLAHGWGGSYDQTWRGSGLESDLTAAGRIVLTVDLPGHGRRPCSHRPADYSDIAEQLWACLPQAEQLDAVGYSLGGKLLLRLAAEHPGSFRRLVILGVGQNAFVPEDGELLATALLQGIPDHAPESLRTLLEEVRCSGNDLESLAAVIQRPPDKIGRAHV